MHVLALESIMICNRDVRRVALATVAIGLFAACDDSKTTTIEDTGAICLVQNDDSVSVTVQIEACLKGSCRSASDVECRAIAASGRITVTSHAKITETTQQGCPDSCDPAVATCELVGVAGDYTIVHGANQTSVTLPIDSPLSIFGIVGGCEL
jgi:hypothetical protein